MKVDNKMAFGAVALATLPKAATIDLAWGINLGTGDQIITLSREGKVLASSCDNSLKIGDLKIFVDADSLAYGNVTIGDASWELGDPEVCGESYNDEFIEAMCTLPIDDDVDFSDAATVDGLLACFPEDEAFGLLPDLNADGVFRNPEHEDPGEEIEHFPADMSSVDPSDPAVTGLEPRQHCGGTGTWKEVIKPDKVWKWIRIEQITTGLGGCGNGITCTVTEGTVRSVTHTASFGVSGLGNWAWINGGYSVSWSTGTITTQGCSSNRAGARICLKNKRRYQQYEVRHNQNVCGQTLSQEYKTYSPLSDDRMSAFYCSHNVGLCTTYAGSVQWDSIGHGRW